MRSALFERTTRVRSQLRRNWRRAWMKFRTLFPNMKKTKKSSKRQQSYGSRTGWASKGSWRIFTHSIQHEDTQQELESLEIANEQLMSDIKEKIISSRRQRKKPHITNKWILSYSLWIKTEQYFRGTLPPKPSQLYPWINIEAVYYLHIFRKRLLRLWKSIPDSS